MSSVPGSAPPARPDPNTYWVIEGRFLAGEYPGARAPAEAREKIAAFLAAGITTFIDLTEPHELAPYQPLLSGTGVEHRRFPIRDGSVPADARQMQEILDAIERALAAGRNVYLHCWGGIGRTGTTVGCWLQRRGRSPDAALAELARFWGTVAKRPRRPQSPETSEQVEWVRRWPERLAALPPDAPPATAGSQTRYRGCLLGLAAGDALGTTLEFKRRGTFTPLTDMVGGGPFGLDAGQWTDDTSMALCLAESLLECGGFDARDQMQRYVRWWQEGYLSSTGTCFDIGNTVSGALRRFLNEEGQAGQGNPFAGSTDPHTAGNGSLMRLAPVPLFFAPAGAKEAIARAGESSRTTHGAAAAVDGCRYLAALILGALAGAAKEELLRPGFAPAGAEDLWQNHPLTEPVAAVAAGSFRTKPPSQIRGTGYVVDSLEAALWAFDRSTSFEAGALLAVNLGDDADTTGAVYGQLAGAFYGEAAIPARWLGILCQRGFITEVADRLCARAAVHPVQTH